MEAFPELFGQLGQPPAASDMDPVGILVMLAITLVLMATISFTYQATHRGALYTQGYVHNLILVGLVASIVLRIVGENLAAGLAIFGAFSIIRFRNAVPETRDVGFIFFAMVVGLATGNGQFDLAIVSTVFMCLVLFALSGLDLFAPERTSHTLRVRVTQDLNYSEAFEAPFRTHLDRATLLRVESVQGGMLTELTYAVRLKADATPRDLVSNLQAITGNNRVLLIAAGPEISN